MRHVGRHFLPWTRCCRVNRLRKGRAMRKIIGLLAVTAVLATAAPAQAEVIARDVLKGIELYNSPWPCDNRTRWYYGTRQGRLIYVRYSDGHWVIKADHLGLYKGVEIPYQGIIVLERGFVMTGHATWKMRENPDLGPGEFIYFVERFNIKDAATGEVVDYVRSEGFRNYPETQVNAGTCGNFSDHDI